MVRGLLFFGEFVLSGEEAEQLAAGTVLQEEVEFAVILETHFHADEEGVLDLGEYLFFGHDVLLLVLFEDVLLLELLEGIELVVLEVADEHHLGVGALADD